MWTTTSRSPSINPRSMAFITPVIAMTVDHSRSARRSAGSDGWAVSSRARRKGYRATHSASETTMPSPPNRPMISFIAGEVTGRRV